MKKSIERLKAEEIIASLVRNENLTDIEILQKAQEYADHFRFQIGLRVSTIVMLATIYDTWEDFTEDQLKLLYKEFLHTYQAYNEGDVNLRNLLLTVDKMVDNDILGEKIIELISTSTEPALTEGGPDEERISTSQIG